MGFFLIGWAVVFWSVGTHIANPSSDRAVFITGYVVGIGMVVYGLAQVFN